MSNDESVTRLAKLVNSRSPPSLRVFRGVLYGARCSKRHLVPVPVDRGIVQLTSLDDLQTEQWVPLPSYDDTGVVCLDHGRQLITSFPGTCTTLRSPFALYAVAQNDPRQRRNALVSRLLPKTYAPWRGDLLVVKYTDQGIPSNIHSVDLELVDLVVKSVITEGNLRGSYILTGHIDS